MEAVNTLVRTAMEVKRAAVIEVTLFNLMAKAVRILMSVDKMEMSAQIFVSIHPEDIIAPVLPRNR